MHSCSDVNERLSSAIHNESYEETLSCLMQGAKATVVSISCGRTAVGSAALIGDVEILALLIQSCEDPDTIFKNGRCNVFNCVVKYLSVVCELKNKCKIDTANGSLIRAS